MGESSTQPVCVNELSNSVMLDEKVLHCKVRSFLTKLNVREGISSGFVKEQHSGGPGPLWRGSSPSASGNRRGGESGGSRSLACTGPPALSFRLILRTSVKGGHP
jgi:hypothetical protein